MKPSKPMGAYIRAKDEMGIGRNCAESSVYAADSVASLTLVLFVAFKIEFVPETAMQLLKCASIVLLILLHWRAAFRIPHFWAVIVLGCVQPLCTYLAGSPPMNVLYAAVNGLCLIALLLTFRSLSDEYGLYRVLKSFFWILLVAAVANDATVFTSPIHEANTGYLLGNKFAVGYIHMLLLGLYATLLAEKKVPGLFNRALFWLMFAESVIVVQRADTMTCMLGLVAVAIVSRLLPKGVLNKLSLGAACVGVLIGINVLFFGTGMMLQNELVRYFITEVLGRSLSLTGRTAIYRELGLIIQMRPLIGWGYGSAIVSQFVGYGNAQNGVIEFLVTYGIIGTASFLLVLLALLPSKRGRDCAEAKGLVAVLYGMFITSLVEISFGVVFYLILALASVALQDGQNADDRLARDGN